MSKYIKKRRSPGAEETWGHQGSVESLSGDDIDGPSDRRFVGGQDVIFFLPSEGDKRCVWLCMVAGGGGGCLCGEIRIVKSDSESSSFVKTLGAELGVVPSSLVSFAPRRSRVEEKLNSRDAHSLEFSETDRRALKQLCYTSFTARVRIILPVYRVELMLQLGELGPV